MQAQGGVVDRSGALAKLREAGQGAVLELGCGERKRRADAVGIDARALPGVDLVGDVFDVLAELPAGCAIEVSSSHFVEHVPDLRRLLLELGRVLRPGGRLEIVVPHFSNAYFWSDYTHARPFGLYSLSYLAHDPIFRRRVPHYEPPVPFTLVRADLRFRSLSAFPVRRLLRRPVGWLVNLSRWTRELYEENLCWLLPCYEIRFVLVRDAAGAPGGGA
jgi:SAM-dependent methyltransferase